MNKKRNNRWAFPVVMLSAFLVWTILVRIVDLQPIGPGGSAVGFATINDKVHQFTGVNFELYLLTDWLGVVPFVVALGFGVLGLTQWMKRGSVKKVDLDILFLGGFYLAVLFVYVIFEVVVINHRPVLIDGVLEVSYPSSTTMLVMCVMPTAMIQWRKRIRHESWRKWGMILASAFTVFMIVGRLLSGVHWVTDIIGGMLLSIGLVGMYLYTCSINCRE